MAAENRNIPTFFLLLLACLLFATCFYVFKNGTEAPSIFAKKSETNTLPPVPVESPQEKPLSQEDIKSLTKDIEDIKSSLALFKEKDSANKITVDRLERTIKEAYERIFVLALVSESNWHSIESNQTKDLVKLNGRWAPNKIPSNISMDEKTKDVILKLMQKYAEDS